MTTQDVIAKVEAIGQSFAVVMKEHGIGSVHMMPAESTELPVKQFVEVCEHFNTQPSVSIWPTAWVKTGEVSVYIRCERVDLPEVKSDALAKLRELVTTANAA